MRAYTVNAISPSICWLILRTSSTIHFTPIRTFGTVCTTAWMSSCRCDSVEIVSAVNWIQNVCSRRVSSDLLRARSDKLFPMQFAAALHSFSLRVADADAGSASHFNSIISRTFRALSCDICFFLRRRPAFSRRKLRRHPDGRFITAHFQLSKRFVAFDRN